MSYPTHLETERLLLRPITTADLDFFARIHADTEVARFISTGEPRTREQTAQVIAQWLDGYARFGRGQLAVVRKTDGALVGRCGISRLELRHTPEGPVERTGWYLPGGTPDGDADEVNDELGYTFDRAAWGFGYAREAAGAVWRHVHRALGVRPVSMIHPDNARSLRLAHSFGVTFVDRVHAMGRTFERFLWPATVYDSEP